MFKEMNVLELFFNEPTREFHVREVAKLLKITPATASKRLKQFKKKGVLQYRKEIRVDFYKANLENEFYLDLKKHNLVRKLKDSGLIEAINNFYLKPTILLFGSSAYGLDTSESDVDLVIISENNKEFKKLDYFEKKIHRNIQLFVFSNIKTVKNKHLLNNMLNGVIIQGEIKWY
jgi:predicted nucleotidyltransferase